MHQNKLQNMTAFNHSCSRCALHQIFLKHCNISCRAKHCSIRTARSNLEGFCGCADSVEKAEPLEGAAKSYTGPSAGCTAVVALVSLLFLCCICTAQCLLFCQLLVRLLLVPVLAACCSFSCWPMLTAGSCSGCNFVVLLLMCVAAAVTAP